MNIKDLTKGILTVRKVADLCGLTVQAVYKWEKSSRGVPPEYCRIIEQATGGAVRCYEMRPDIFAAPTNPEAAQ